MREIVRDAVTSDVKLFVCDALVLRVRAPVAVDDSVMELAVGVNRTDCVAPWDWLGVPIDTVIDLDHDCDRDAVDSTVCDRLCDVDTDWLEDADFDCDFGWLADIDAVRPTLGENVVDCDTVNDVLRWTVKV